MRSAWKRLALAIGLVLLAVWTVKTLGLKISDVSPERIRGFVDSFGVWAPLIYLTVYGQPVIPLPASVMMMAAGLAFGPLWGVVAAVIGSVIRASGQFALARALGRTTVERLLKGRAASLDALLGVHAVATVALIRLIPIGLPFDVQNFGLGLSRVPFLPYVMVTFFAMIPVCILWVALGYALLDLRNLWAVAILLVVGLLCGRVWRLKWITRRNL